MIQVGISYGTGDDNRYNLESIPRNIQLAMYKYELFKQNESQVIEALRQAETNVLTVHLPLDTLHMKPHDVLRIMSDLHQQLDCPHFIIHPNKKIKDFISTYIVDRKCTDRYKYKICIETFGWKSKKVLRTPLEIMEYCIRHQDISMCIDTSHIEELWFEHKIMRTLLKHTSVIHLSNRAKGHGSHMPFNSPHGELNLVKFVIDLKNVYDWHGTIILEYMHEHQNKLIKNYQYIQRLLGDNI